MSLYFFFFLPEYLAIVSNIRNYQRLNHHLLDYLELIQDRKIVQSWRSNEEGWPKTYYSTITIELESVEAGTRLTFKQTEVPLASFKSVKEGWTEYYWQPLKNMLEK